MVIIVAPMEIEHRSSNIFGGPEQNGFYTWNNHKKVKEKPLKTIQNREFYLLNLEFQTIKIQFF